MVGTGNVGLIVSYQMLQAGVNVMAVVEAAPEISGYRVHARKLMRAGVPIYTSATVKEVLGDRDVKQAVITPLDRNFKPAEGEESHGRGRHGLRSGRADAAYRTGKSC